MTFESINKDMEDAHQKLETAILATIAAEEALDDARIKLVQAESAKKRSRLEQKLAQERMDGLKERSWNLRSEAKNLR